MDTNTSDAGVKTPDIPPPPAGFVLDSPKKAEAKEKPPEPPKGFKLDSSDSPDLKAVFSLPAAQMAGKLGAKTRQAAAQFAKQQDPDVDYSGVSMPTIRAQYSFLDTPEERQQFLKQHFGDVTQDSFGRDVVKINGQKVAFLPRGDRDTGKPGATASAWADVAGDVAPVAGMMIGSLATAPIPGASIAGSGIGAAGGKAVNKIIKQVMGANLQDSQAIATDIAMEVPKGAAAQAGVE